MPTKETSKDKKPVKPAKTKAPTKKEAVTEPVSPETAATEAPGEIKPLAKAGKRSAKAVKEQAEKQAKEEHKLQAAEATTPQKTIKQPRSLIERRGKKYRDLVKLIDQTRFYQIKDAVDLAIKTSPAKFDATVELHIRLRVDSRQADQNVRDTITLPSGTGKKVRIAVFTEATDDADIKKAGPDIIGVEAIIAKIEKNQLDFDSLIAPPSLMSRLGKYAKVLGPRGLMPSPKSGTVTNDIVKAINELKLGRVEYRVDSNGIVHLGVGKVSFGLDKLLANVNAVLTSINGNRPSSVKGNFIRSAYISTSMGPSIRLDTSISAES